MSELKLKLWGKCPIPSSHACVHIGAEPVKHLHFGPNLLATLKKNKFAAFNKRIESKGAFNLL